MSLSVDAKLKDGKSDIGLACSWFQPEPRVASAQRTTGPNT